MIRQPYLLAFGAAMFVSGCDQASLMKKAIPADEEAAARNYVELLVNKDFEKIERDTDPKLVDAGTSGTLARMAAFFPVGETPKSVKVIGAYTNYEPTSSRTQITLEYEFQHNWVLTDITRETRDGTATILGFHVYAIADSVEHQNRFTLAGKGAAHYSFLILALALITFDLYVLVLCVRSQGVKRKWLWIIFVLFGFGRVYLNWTNGAVDTMLISIQAPVVMATRPLYGAWTITLTVPLGAILFLRSRKRNAPESKLTGSSHVSEPTLANPQP